MSESFAPIPTLDLTPHTLVNTTEASAFKRMVVSAVCVGSALMPATPTEPTAPKTQPVAETTITLPPYGLQECPPVTDKALAAVDTLLAEPEDPGALQEYSPPVHNPTLFPSVDPSAEPPLTAQQKNHRAWETKAKMAARTDQVMHDPAPYADKLAVPLANPFMPSLPFSEYVAAAAEFGDRYGIAVRLAGQYDTSLAYWGFYPHSVSNETSMARKGIVDVINHLGGLTEEYVRLSGVREIVLYDEPQDVKWGGFSLTEDGQVALPLGMQEVSERVFTHEYGHHEANKTCGGAYDAYDEPNGSYKDPQFDNLPGEKISAEDVSVAVTEIQEQQSDGLAARDYVKACAATQEINDANQQIGAITAYGETDPGENKADIISQYGTQQLYDNALDSEAPAPLKQRTRLTLARLYMASKNVATYFIRLMPRKHGINLLAQACRTGDFSQWESSNNGMK